MGTSHCPGELPWAGVTGTSRVLQRPPHITHRSSAIKSSQQGLTLTPLCSWVPPHSDTQEIQNPACPFDTRAAFLSLFQNSGCSKSGLMRAPCSKAASGTDGIWAQLLGWGRCSTTLQAQHHVPGACNEMKTPFGEKLEPSQTIASPDCWSF